MTYASIHFQLCFIELDRVGKQAKKQETSKNYLIELYLRIPATGPRFGSFEGEGFSFLIFFFSFFFFFLLHLQSIVCICFVFVWLVPILFNLAISIPLFLFPFFLSFFFYHVPTSLFLLLLLPWTEAPEYCALCYVAYSFLYYAWWIESFTSCYGCIVIPEDLNGRLI